MTSSGEMSPTAKAWDAPNNQQSHSYIWQYGASLVEMLNPQPGERVLDLGCGTGHLAAEIARAGCEVVGIDNSPDMVRIAKENFQTSPFITPTPKTFISPKGSTPCFPTRPLHWIKEAEQGPGLDCRLPKTRWQDSGGNGGEGQHCERSIRPPERPYG